MEWMSTTTIIVTTVVYSQTKLILRYHISTLETNGTNTTIYPNAIDKLKDGTLTWKEYLASLSPEEVTALRKREREKAKKWYQENKERKRHFDKQFYAQKRGIVLYDEDL